MRPALVAAALALWAPQALADDPDRYITDARTAGQALQFAKALVALGRAELRLRPEDERKVAHLGPCLERAATERGFVRVVDGLSWDGAVPFARDQIELAVELFDRTASTELIVTASILWHECQHLYDRRHSPWDRDHRPPLEVEFRAMRAGCAVAPSRCGARLPQMEYCGAPWASEGVLWELRKAELLELAPADKRGFRWYCRELERGSAEGSLRLPEAYSWDWRECVRRAAAEVLGPFFEDRRPICRAFDERTGWNWTKDVDLGNPDAKKLARKALQKYGTLERTIVGR